VRVAARKVLAQVLEPSLRFRTVGPYARLWEDTAERWPRPGLRIEPAHVEDLLDGGDAHGRTVVWPILDGACQEDVGGALAVDGAHGSPSG
jgi:hypothetical protein